MDTAVFNAGFLGAETLGLETYNPATTRWLNGLLLLRNILLPETPDLDTLFSQQIHGGVYAYPYAIEQVLTLAAILGFPQRPFRRLV